MKKKILIILGSLAGSLILLAYLAFLFVLPNVIDLNQYKPLIQEAVKEQIPLNTDFKNAKISVTPMLSAGVKIDDISVKFEDGTTLFSADNATVRIALPSIFVLTVKVPTLEVNNPKLNFTIIDGKQFKILTLVEQILQKQEESVVANDTQTAQELPIDPSIIRIKIPNIKLNNYDVTITDEQSGHKLELKGDQLRLGYFNGKVLKAKTSAEFYSDENKNITADIDINTYLPKVEGLDEEDDKPERVELPFVNPVLMYRQYDLKSNIAAKIKTREKNGLVKINGFLNIDDTTLNLSNYRLPTCYFHGKFNGTKTDIDTDIAVTQSQRLKILGMLDYGKNPKIDMSFNSDRIYFQDLITLAKAFLDSIHVRNDLNLIKGKGYIEANADVKSNLKKLVSNGKIEVRDGAIINKNINLGITGANVNLIFDNNNLDIKDTYMYINNAPLKAEGNINEKSIADIKIYANQIPISGLFRAFAPKEVKKSISINDGKLTLNSEIKGKLKTAVCKAKIDLDNFLMQDLAGSIRITDDNLNIVLNSDGDSKVNNIDIVNKGLSIVLPQVNSLIKDNLLKVNITGSKLTIEPTDIMINSNSKITFDGIIESDKKEPLFNINGKGSLSAADLRKFAGLQAEPFIAAKGEIPLELAVNGDMKRQNLILRLLADANNYITYSDYKQLHGKDTVIQAKVDFKGSRLKIKDTGLFIRTTSTNENGEVTENLKPVSHISGTITNLNSTPFINVIKITIPENLDGNLVGFKNAGYTLDKGKLFIFGNADAPRFRGNLGISKLYIKDLLTSLDSLNLAFKGKTLSIYAKNLLLNGSDISAQTDISLEPSAILNVSNLRLTSKLLDLDKLMTVSDKAMKMIPPAPANSAQSNSAQADIPVNLTNSSISLNHIKTGNINVYNTTSKLALYRNILYINDLKTKAFDGKINGDVSMNLITNLLKIKVSGKDIDTDKMMTDTAGMKDTLSGRLQFNTDISIDAAAANYEEQMKSLAGNLDFTILNGQFGPFGKLENMILAENIRESQFFQTAIGGMLSGLTSIDTTHYKELKGDLLFKDGITTINSITSDGNVLTLLVFGDFDLIKNAADMKVRARLASMVSNILGPLASVNPVNLVKVTPGLNVASAKMFSLFTQAVTSEELSQIPEFDTKTDNFNATNFQIIVKGDVAKPLKLVKSFKWLALQDEINKASEFVASLPEPDSLDETMADIEAQQAEEAKTSTKIKNIFSKKDKKLEEQKKLETQEALKKMREDSEKNNI
ncbi:hypothetical protein IJ818_02500 [bacterium]|nr:hypothetical protein [bacterium]